MKFRLAVAATAAVGLLAGCADVVAGAGSTASGLRPPSGSSAPDFPTSSGKPSAPAAPSSIPAAPSSIPVGPSGAPAEQATSCPHVTYPVAKLSFDCIASGLEPNGAGHVWPLTEVKVVEPSTDWVLEEGAGHWGSAEGHSLATIAANVRAQMVNDGGYGDSPKVSTVVNKDTTVAGVKAHLLQTTMTLDPTWAKKNRTKVKQEKLWILALQVGTDDVSLWYTSIPDLAKTLWPKVPAVIDSIKVG